MTMSTFDYILVITKGKIEKNITNYRREGVGACDVLLCFGGIKIEATFAERRKTL